MPAEVHLGQLDLGARRDAGHLIARNNMDWHKVATSTCQVQPRDLYYMSHRLPKLSFATAVRHQIEAVTMHRKSESNHAWGDSLRTIRPHQAPSMKLTVANACSSQRIPQSEAFTEQCHQTMPVGFTEKSNARAADGQGAEQRLTPTGCLSILLCRWHLQSGAQESKYI